MSWMLSILVAVALLALCGGQNAEHEGNSLSPSGYHLCVHNETRIVSFLAMHKVPYTVTKPCGGWLLWKTCTVTVYQMIHQTEYKTVMEQVTRCCDGYVQVGHYCALPVNRSGEFTAKPGSCPTADGLYPESEDCELDMDCPGWEKCCQRSGFSRCSNPESSANYSDNGGYRLNATVTVKADYQQLMSSDGGHLHHTRLLQAMVTGALQSEVSIFFLSSWPVHPYRTATSLLIESNVTLSLHNVTSKLHLLLKHIQEVSSVTVEDVNECAQSPLCQCSPLANCYNTEGSYHCACRRGYIDVDPSNPGAHCTADANVSSTAEPPLTHLPPVNTTYTPASNSTPDLPDNSTAGVLNSTEPSMTTALSNTSSVPYNSSDAPPWTSSLHTSMSSTVPSPLPTTTCSPPGITSLRSFNVTGTSFCVYWSSQSQMNQTYQVVLSKGSEVIHSWTLSQTTKEIGGLQPGVLYDVAVTPQACGSQGAALHISIKTNAQTLDATARLTNIDFTADLQNTSSQAYKNLSEGIIDEIYQSLSPEMRAMVDSGQVRIEITSFSQGSVLVNFTIIFTPSQSQNISNVSTALLHSLLNSTKYAVDENNTSINDVNECANGEHDCSEWARCTNLWGSYTCECLVGFTDSDPGRPGRACQAIPTSSTTPTVVSTTVPPTTLVSHSTAGTTAASTSIITAPATTTTAPTTTTTAPTTTTTASTTTTTAPTTTTTAPTTTTTAPTTITTATTTPTAPTTTAPITTTSAPTTTAPIITTAIPTTAAPATTTTAPATTTTAPTSTASATTTTVPSTTTTTTITTASSTTTTITPTTTATSTTTAFSTSTADPTTTVTNPTSSSPALTTDATVQRGGTSPSMQGSISVQCRVAAITVTVDKDFLQAANIRESALYLGSPECGVNGGNSTHVQLTVAWNECITRIVHNETYYTASVTLYNSMDSYTSPTGTVETPSIRLEVPIMCTYLRSMLISSDFGSMGYDMIQDVLMGSGSFQVTVQLMNGTMPLPHNYSMSPEEAVVVEVSLNTSSEQIKMVISKCWATPTQNPSDAESYIFLENSCSVNTYTKVLMNGNSSTSRVSVQIFSFVNLYMLYLHCQVQICVEIGSSTCVPDCLQRTARSGNTIGTAMGSSGPLLRSEEPLEENDLLHIVGLSCLGIGLSLFFIVGFVCLFYYQRNRIGHYNFSVKPKQENFTYLVFNT